MSGIWRDSIPIPVDDAHPEFVEFYNFAWELAHRNVKDISGMPQNPVMKEGYLDFYIWIWDTCLMSLFTKYAQAEFPGYQSLRNFYEPLYDGRRLPDVKVTSKPFPWLTQEVGDVVPMLISIADNPPLFAWAEERNARFHGDLERVRNLLEKQYLQRHFRFFETAKAGQRVHGCDLPCAIEKTTFGYHWGGLQSGMDNSPRGRVGEHVVGKNAKNQDMLWIDALAQQGLAALSISRLARLVGDDEMSDEWERKHKEIATLINERYWDEEDGFYYDISENDGHFYKVMTPASFWVLLAEIAPEERARRVIDHLLNPQELGGDVVPCVSLSRNDADFNAVDGHYWRGAMWLPLAYVAIKSLEKYGQFDFARELSEKVVAAMCRTWRDYSPHTIWECYAPNSFEPARTGDDGNSLVRADFCGWSALGPIALYIENVIGIHSVDAFSRTIHWHLPKDAGRIGVKNLRFGDVKVDLVYCGNKIEVNSMQPLTLVVNGKEMHHSGNGACKWEDN